LNEAIRLHALVTGERPRGMVYSAARRFTPSRLAAAEGGFDWFPIPMTTTCLIGSTMAATARQPQLVIPYTLDANDMRFATPQGFNRRPVLRYLKDAFDTLYAEGQAGQPGHDEHRPALPPDRSARTRGARCRNSSTTCRATTRSGSRRAATSRGTGARRIPTPRRHRAPVAGPEEEFVAKRFGDIFEHSPWIAERAFDLTNFRLRTIRRSALHNALAPSSSARRARRSGWAFSTPTRTSPASWPWPSG
jgi:hypothetical protein